MNKEQMKAAEKTIRSAESGKVGQVLSPRLPPAVFLSRRRGGRMVPANATGSPVPVLLANVLLWEIQCVQMRKHKIEGEKKVPATPAIGSKGEAQYVRVETKMVCMTH